MPARMSAKLADILGKSKRLFKGLLKASCTLAGENGSLTKWQTF